MGSGAVVSGYRCGFGSPVSGDRDAGRASVEWMQRLCSRPLCSREAEAALSFDYARGHVRLEALGDSDPHVLDLCAVHAERFDPPRGWTLEDARGIDEMFILTAVESDRALAG